MEISAPDFQRHLDALTPQIGNYEWMWRLLRARARRHGWFPRKLYALLKRFANPRRPYFLGETGEGVRFLGDCRDTYAACCAVLPDYDTPLIRFITEQMRAREGAYLDIGTNLGVVAASVAQRLEGRNPVVAFEPIPLTAARAAATFALNGLTSVRLYQAAVGDQEGEITFYDAPGCSEAASAHRTKQGIPISWVEIRVSCRTLDGLARDGAFDRVGLMKVDVEGHEPNVLRGAAELIARDHPPILYEYNHDIAAHVGWHNPDIAALLTGMAPYRFYLLQDSALAELPPPQLTGGVVNVYAQPCE
jgi:FkbM family methyltransferase